ncbi:MAG: bifunctional diaminohydroxyphosphoribosylaminopyrimidine deaminase/5-amino-6-(5-phosphoribosylamino)uracil reductase RibD [Cyclobacteriaceae bacterium]|nr:bifunctional diaminohydroxyphosphoribosylaminopyrimidine deaminase/5-amino-6-(5-phosphoribosylamino)uracil reductase RibD [Cyclobacteriaceae bacterium]MCH8517268.1 bifunctional diaminohydroxyphosphoribosylaminopyrimidine deaminase/5-amino-6-(5-phosphoribosylamino)uracil reductase RibD [Cyclobacteriaceae bacterium]
MNKINDIEFMRRAIELASKGMGKASPNPLVGCVLVKRGRIIGEGYHEQHGKAHAEVNAIKDAQNRGEPIDGSTAYVSLEPCSHFGKTPPCADLLIKHQVARVCIATVDPFEKVAGNGIQKLKNAGIEVAVGLLEDEAKLMNRFFLKGVRTKMPYIVLKWAQTKDGFVARENYDSKWISNLASRTLVHRWRSELDGIMVGANTAIYDNPQLDVRLTSQSKESPQRILLDRSLRCLQHPTLNLFTDGKPTWVYHQQENAVSDRGQVRFFTMPKENFEEAVLRDLYDKNIGTLMIEGGSQILHSFIKNELWDEARVFVGKESFGVGIKAPSFPLQATESFKISETQLNIYRK